MAEPHWPETPAPAALLDFWFGAPPWAPRAAWFRKDPAFDAEVRTRFLPLIEQALAGTLPAAWDADTPARLAHLLLLDQLTRNAFRDSARAFAGDARALALARRMLDAGEERTLPPVARWFVLLPLEHAEDAALQHESVRRFEALAEDDPTLADAADYARRHRDVILRFGRFPHRNRWLGRESTPEEQAYLAEPGSGF